MRRLHLSLVAALIAAPAVGQAQSGSSGPGVFDFIKRELAGSAFAGLMPSLTNPEKTGKGYWNSYERRLVFDQPRVMNQAVAETALRKLGTYCQQQGGQFTHDVPFDPPGIRGLHSCKTTSGVLFEVDAYHNNTPAFYLQLTEGENTEQRAAYAKHAAKKAEAGEHLAAFQQGLAAGSTVSFGTNATRALVVEVKGPLAFVQVSGRPAEWVKVEDLRPIE